MNVQSNNHTLLLTFSLSKLNNDEQALCDEKVKGGVYKMRIWISKVILSSFTD